MNTDELRHVMETEEEIEYHVTGGEIDTKHLLPGPGWYPCIINWICENGNVEISFTNPELDEIGVTVLKKNISIAFRQKVVSHD